MNFVIVQPTVDLLNQFSNVFQTKSNFYEFYELADDALRIVGVVCVNCLGELKQNSQDC